jgi:hypothetical protein
MAAGIELVGLTKRFGSSQGTPVHVYLPADALRVLAGPALVSDAVPLAS